MSVQVEKILKHLRLLYWQEGGEGGGPRIGKRVVGARLIEEGVGIQGLSSKAHPTLTKWLFKWLTNLNLSVVMMPFCLITVCRWEGMFLFSMVLMVFQNFRGSGPLSVAV